MKALDGKKNPCSVQTVKESHIVFWIQDCMQEGKISLPKRSTQEMWADLMTKASEGPRIKQLLDLMSFEFKSGSHPLALRV